MESVFILVLAGLAVVLLGMVLIASERELKSKRREIAGLVERLEAQSQTASAGLVSEIAASGDLVEQNRRLENDIHALSAELAEARRFIETTSTGQFADNAAQERIRLLTDANEQLAREAEELRSRLGARDFDLQSAQGEENGPALNRMQAEIDELRRALEMSHGRVTELEEARAIAAERENERQNDRAQIAELENQLAERRRELAEAQTLRDRLADSENRQEALRAEIDRHQAEIARWRTRTAAAEEAADRLTALQGPYEELLAAQADLADRQRRLCEDFAAFGQRIAPASGSYTAHPDAGNAGSAGPNPAPFNDTAPTALGAAPSQGASDAPADPRTRRFGVLGALLFVAATGIVGVQFLGSEWEQPAAQVMSAQTSPARIAPPTVAELRSPENPAEIANQNGAAVGPNHFKPTHARNKANGAQHLAAPETAGTYEIIQPSRVYTAPSEISRPLGEIDRGVKVNVVDGRDGWLEIHSKHGRPPGFIRREVAARSAAD
jgi:hypothetical protein